MSFPRDLQVLFVSHFVVGAVVVFAPVASTVLGGIALVARRTAAARWLVGLGVVGLCMSLATTMALAARMRWAILHSSHDLLPAVDAALVAQYAASALGIVATVVLATAWAASGPAVARVHGLAAGAMATLVLGYAFVDARALAQGVRGECFEVNCRYAALVEDAPAPTAIRALVLGVGLTAALVLALLRPSASRSRAANLALLALGIAGYLGTRSFAADGASPVPLIDAPRTIEWTPIVDLPPAPERCAAIEPFIDVAVTDGAYIGGMPVADVGGALEARLTLAHSIDIHERAVGIRAAKDAPESSVRPVIAAVRRAGFHAIFANAAPAHRSVETRSLGTLSRSARTCSVRLPEPTSGVPSAAPPSTWGDFVARTAAAPR
jgi:hypothetical protein